MRAIVLAAGEGSRLRPLTVTRPKPMVRAANKPILEYVVEALVANRVKDITLVVGYHRAKVQTFFGDGQRFDANLTYAFQDVLSGTAMALATAPPPEGPFILLSGDNVVDPALIRRAISSGSTPGIVVHRSEQPSRYGVVTLEGSRIESIVEKPIEPRSDWVSTGVYRLPAEFHARARLAVKKNVTRMPDLLAQAIAEGVHVEALKSDDLWADAVYPWDLLRVNAELLRRNPPPAPVLDSVHAETPVLIGKNVSLGPGVQLEAGTVIGDNVQIRGPAVLENTTIYDDVQIAPYALLQSTIVAEGTRIGPRFSAFAGPAEVRTSDGWHELEEFGAVVGEDCHIGGNVTLMPGCMLGNRARVAYGRVISGSIPDGSILG